MDNKEKTRNQKIKDKDDEINEEEREIIPEKNDNFLSDKENSALTAEEKIGKLKKDLADCLKEKNEYLAGWQRTKADSINARKKEEENRETLIKFSNKELLREFLSVADSLEMAIKNYRNAGSVDSGWQTGIEQIQRQFARILENYGVSAMETEGKIFDPAWAESIEEKIVNEQKFDKIILEELQKGYKIHDQILRPAKVKIGAYKNPAL